MPKNGPRWRHRWQIVPDLGLPVPNYYKKCIWCDFGVKFWLEKHTTVLSLSRPIFLFRSILYTLDSIFSRNKDMNLTIFDVFFDKNKISKFLKFRFSEFVKLIEKTPNPGPWSMDHGAWLNIDYLWFNVKKVAVHCVTMPFIIYLGCLNSRGGLIFTKENIKSNSKYLRFMLIKYTKFCNPLFRKWSHLLRKCYHFRNKGLQNFVYFSIHIL